MQLLQYGTKVCVKSMFRDLSLTAISMGLLAAFVGYAASFAIVLAGLSAMGASDGQAATGLFFATLGICPFWMKCKTTNDTTPGKPWAAKM